MMRRGAALQTVCAGGVQLRRHTPRPVLYFEGRDGLINLTADSVTFQFESETVEWLPANMSNTTFRLTGNASLGNQLTDTYFEALVDQAGGQRGVAEGAEVRGGVVWSSMASDTLLQVAHPF